MCYSFQSKMIESLMDKAHRLLNNMLKRMLVLSCILFYNDRLCTFISVQSNHWIDSDWNHTSLMWWFVIFTNQSHRCWIDRINEVDTCSLYSSNSLRLIIGSKSRVCFNPNLIFKQNTDGNVSWIPKLHHSLLIGNILSMQVEVNERITMVSFFFHHLCYSFSHLFSWSWKRTEIWTKIGYDSF